MGHLPRIILVLMLAGGRAPWCLAGDDTAAAQLIERAREAQADGLLDEADAAYRRAWALAEDKATPAAALEGLHRLPGFLLPVDEEAVAATARLVGPLFARRETEHFVILSDCPIAWTDKRAQLLERTRHEFFRTMDRLGVPVIPHRRKLLCVLFDSEEAFRAFGVSHDAVAADWVGGYYASGSNRIVFFNDTNGRALDRAMENLDGYEREAQERRRQAQAARQQGQRDYARRLLASAQDIERQVRAERRRILQETADKATAKATHEAAHLLAYNTGAQATTHAQPFWLSEGLAMAFETAGAGAAFGPEQVYTPRLERYHKFRDEGRLMPLAELVSLDDAPRGDQETVESAYTQSYVLFTFLYRYEREALGTYMRTVSDPANRPAGPAWQVRVFQEHFGDVSRLERKLLRF